MNIETKIINENHYIVIEINSIQYIYNLCKENELSMLYNFLFLIYNIVYKSFVEIKYISTIKLPYINIYTESQAIGISNNDTGKYESTLILSNRNVISGITQTMCIDNTEILKLAEMLYETLTSTLYYNMLKNTREYDLFINLFNCILDMEG